MYRYCKREYKHKVKLLYQEFYHDDFLPVMLNQIVLTNINNRNKVEKFVTGCYDLFDIKKIKHNKRAQLPSMERVNNLYDLSLLISDDLILDYKISQNKALNLIVDLFDPEIYFEINELDTGGEFDLGNDFKMIKKNLKIKSILC